MDIDSSQTNTTSIPTTHFTLEQQKHLPLPDSHIYLPILSQNHREKEEKLLHPTIITTTTTATTPITTTSSTTSKYIKSKSSNITYTTTSTNSTSDEPINHQATDTTILKSKTPISASQTTTTTTTFEKKKINNNDAKIHLIAGALSRLTESSIMYPLSTIKTLLQFQGGTASHSIRQNYRGIFNAFITNVKSEGATKLYRGFFPHLLYVIPSASISFVCYEAIAKHFRKNQHELHQSTNNNNNSSNGDKDYRDIILPLIGMSLARMSGSVIRTPFDKIVMMMQISGNLKRDHSGGGSARELLRRIVSKEGIGGLFKYSYVSILRDLPFTFIYFTGYEVMRNNLRARDGGKHEVSSIEYVIIGGLAGAIATVPTIPIDVIKTKLQTEDALPRKNRFSGVWTAVQGIFKQEGLRGFTKGLGTRLLHIMPSAGISFASYEFYKNVLKRYYD